jgi:hypothetical protein
MSNSSNPCKHLSESEYRSAIKPMSRLMPMSMDICGIPLIIGFFNGRKEWSQKGRFIASLGEITNCLIGIQTGSKQRTASDACHFVFPVFLHLARVRLERCHLVAREVTGTNYQSPKSNKWNRELNTAFSFSLCPPSPSNTHPVHETSNIIHLPNLKPQHLVTHHTRLIHHLRRCLGSGRRNAILKPLPLARRPPIRKRIRERQVFRQKTQLAQHGGLVPADVFMVQAVAAHVYHGGEGDADVTVGWGDTGDAGGC